VNARYTSAARRPFTPGGASAWQTTDSWRGPAGSAPRGQHLAWLGVRIFVPCTQTACLLLPLLLAHQLPPLPLPLVHYLRLHGRQHVPVCRHGKEHDSFACSSKLEGQVVLCLHT